MPNTPPLIAPSILSANFARLGDQIQTAESAGANRFHIDVMDGRFVPNITIGGVVVESIRPITQLPLDVHLMIIEPQQHLKLFVDAGADIISVHWEASPHLHRALQQIRELGCQAGVALNPHTPARVLSEVMHMLDQVIVMTVNPGFGGQAFLPETLPKIRQVRAMIDQQPNSVDLVVDGGVNEDTIQAIHEAGANVFVAGSAVFRHSDGIETGMQVLREALANE